MKQQWPLDVTVSFDPYFGEPSRDGEQFAEVLPDGRASSLRKSCRTAGSISGLSRRTRRKS